MSLAIGNTAPDFTLVTLGEEGPELFNLYEQLKESKVVLLFIPMAFTGVCTDEFCQVSEDLSAYESLNAKVIGISGDNPFAQAEWAKKESISLKLVSDYEHKVAEEYGVAYESFLPEANLIMGGVAKRSAFVINQDKTLSYVEVQDHPKDLPDFTAIKKALS